MVQAWSKMSKIKETIHAYLISICIGSIPSNLCTYMFLPCENTDYRRSSSKEPPVIDTHHRQFLILAACVNHTSHAVFYISPTAYNINHRRFSIYRIFKHRIYTYFIHRLYTDSHRLHTQIYTYQVP
jgi:hypothetical protein